MRIVIPVKRLSEAKTRLAPVLSAGERSTLMCGLIDHVLAVAMDVAPVSVVTADDIVARRARASGADVIDEQRVAGLNRAARLGVERLRSDGEVAILLLAADLPDVTAGALQATLALWRPGTMTIAPSRDGGTNALALSTSVDFRFAYGAHSFEGHCAEAMRLGMEISVHECAELGVDIDRPQDLAGHPEMWAA